MTRRRHPWRWVAAAYAAALVASHVARVVHPTRVALGPEESVLTVGPVRGAVPRRGSPVRVAWLDRPAQRPDAPAIVLLHGSPGSNGQVGPLGGALERTGRFRILAPDLPGFGGSSPRVPDYSIAAHAGYVRQLLDSLGIRRAHFVGYSMGGGVALHLAAASPDRVASLTLVSSIGIQEYELLGDYYLNHAIHGLQLAGLWALTELVPHFGWMDDAVLGVPYARNFFDSDQRPLRRILQAYQGPMLIVQGNRDELVPPSIAVEHGRLVPQSVVRVIPGGHFMVFTQAPEVASIVADFVQQVETGTARTRATALPERVAQANQPFDPRNLPRPAGFSLAIVLVLLAAATLVSEDLACVAAGLLVGRGTLAFLPATLACLIGIAAGDLLLFLTGRVLGRPAVRRAPLRWFVSEADIERASHWFSRKGLSLVLATRFMPGTRMPTYVAAGVLRTSLPGFAVAFLIAAAAWTPLLVGASALVGGEFLGLLAGHRQIAGPLFAGGLLGLFLVVRLGIAASTWRGRRLLLSRWRRLTRWEFWPRWAFYPPVAAYVLWLGLRHRSLTLFTASNPAIPGGGLAGESKFAILEGLGLQGSAVAAAALLPASLPLETRVTRAEAFLATLAQPFPVVLKPDVGERGGGVVLARDWSAVRGYLDQAAADVMIQEYVPGHEFGVFYYCLPGEAAGRILSITDKRLPVVIGDGVRTLERLILGDARAVCSAKRFLAQHCHTLDTVPAPGEPVALTQVGTHSRGALFLDGTALATPALQRALDEISGRYEGFWFGRYDLRARSAETLQAGGPFTVIELNGVGSEATSIYDPHRSLAAAYRTLFFQWRLAFEIGRRNRARGAQPMSLGGLLRLLRRHRAATRAHVDPVTLPETAPSPTPDLAVPATLEA